MIECETEVSVVKTTRKTLRLTEYQVLNILRRWAEREHSMYQADVDLDIAYDGFLRGAEIVATQVEACDD